MLNFGIRRAGLPSQTVHDHLRSAGRLAAAIAMAVALLVAVSVSGAGIATAAPKGCQWYSAHAWMGRAMCSGGNGYYQAYVICDQRVWPWSRQLKEGPWKRAASGQWSEAFCSWDYRIVSTNVGLKN